MANKKGRNKPQYINLHRGVTNSAAWNSLSCEARCLVLLVWGRHNGSNNGAISLSYREAKAALGVGTSKIQRAFSDAIDRGFLIQRADSSFDWKYGAGKAAAREWEITTEKCDKKAAKSTYRTWVEKEKNGTASGTQRHCLRNDLPEKAAKTAKTELPEEPLSQKPTLERHCVGNTNNIPYIPSQNTDTGSDISAVGGDDCGDSVVRLETVR